MEAVVNLFKKFLAANWCFIGVIVFFIVHRYSEYQHVVPFKNLIPLLAVLLGTSIILFFINRKLLRSSPKANLLTSFIFVVVLFFGVFQDFLVQFRFLANFTRFRFFVPFTLLLIVVFFIWIKRTNRPLHKAILYLNTLLLIYMLIDAGTLLKHRGTPSGINSNELAKHQLHPCDTCNKPPVYLILLDGYFGSKGLTTYFHYDNTRFENFLQRNDFHVASSTHSNYVFTLYSMASLLNMKYLEGIGEPVLSNHYGYVTAATAIKENIVCKYFTRQGYSINNFSIFDVADIPAGYSSGLLPEKVQLINTQTMYYRVNKWIASSLEKTGLKKQSVEEYENSFINNNEAAMERTLLQSRSQGKQPSFTYCHLVMPHEPYVLDSNGVRVRKTADLHRLSKDSIDQLFLQYQIYVNKRISTFIEALKKATAGNAVILLMSDHGYKEASVANDANMPFYNLNAVYLPQKNYSGWYNGMSNVNQFRLLLNTLFHQQMPLLPDSIVTK